MKNILNTANSTEVIDNPKKWYMNKKLITLVSSTIKYLLSIPDLQLLHFPPSIKKEIRGMLLNQLIFDLQSGQ